MAVPGEYPQLAEVPRYSGTNGGEMAAGSWEATFIISGRARPLPSFHVEGRPARTNAASLGSTLRRAESLKVRRLLPDSLR